MEDLQTLINNAATAFGSHGCLLCGQKPELVGIFIPNTQFIAANPKAASKHIYYPACKACIELADSPTRFESAIAAKLEAVI